MASITCYDLRFGEWVRMAALAGAKILFVPAAWPHPRLAHWQILNRARAIENQLFVVAVNSCGTCDVIRHLAEKQSCLFVGRCADYILRDHPRCANVFVSASPEARIERLMKLHNISSEEAEELMEKADKKRSSYYNYYSYKTWGAAATYHLCIDSSVLGIDGTVEFIKNFVKLKLHLD